MFNKNYVLLVWGLLLISAPIAFCLLTLISTPNEEIKLGRVTVAIALFCGYGLVYSIPGFLTIHIFYLWIKERVTNLHYLKGIAIILGIPAIFSAFLLYFKSEIYNQDTQYLILVYVCTLVILVFISPIRTTGL